MRKVLPIAAFVSMAIAAQTASAGDYPVREGAIDASLMFSVYNYDNDRMESDGGRLDNAKGPTFGLGYNVTNQIAVEGMMTILDSGLSNNAASSANEKVETDGVAYHVDGVYHINVEDKVVPYVAVGLGRMALDDNFDGNDRNETLINYGAGLKFFTTEDLAIRADVRGFTSFDEEQTDVRASIGVSYSFGGKKPVKKPVVIDSDKDGVNDNQDKCANTPAGTQIDSTGCAIDKDGDGVLNAKDQCPNTPKGYKVAGDGCEMDSDKDGVVDRLDQCANTPLNIKVNAKGCEADDNDGDGVLNSKDQCPNTPAGASVDGNGCGLDGDKDGVIDLLDKCADTPLGAKIDDKGCQIILKEEVSINLALSFSSGSAKVQENHHFEINKVADFMIQYPSTKVIIEGHSDSRGKASFNKKLSQKRADSVKQYLVDARGIDVARIQAIGYGEERPIASNKTREGRDKNRRVVAVIKATVSKPQ